jgi:hypothetical protein
MSGVAEAFYVTASARNLSVWYDKLIPGGLDWRDSIVAAIEGCEIVLILFSEESNKSRQLIKELTIADKLSKFVVPVLIENTSPVARTSTRWRRGTGSMSIPILYFGFRHSSTVFPSN